MKYYLLANPCVLRLEALLLVRVTWADICDNLLDGGLAAQAGPMIYLLLLGPGILVRVCSTTFQPWKGRKLKRKKGFLGLQQVLLGWVGGVGLEKGLVCNYGSSPRAGEAAVTYNGMLQPDLLLLLT